MTAAIAFLALATLARAQAPLAFEVAAVKPQGSAAGDGRPDVQTGNTSGCDGGFPRLEGKRFIVTTTPYALISWAYGYNKTWGCSGAFNFNLEFAPLNSDTFAESSASSLFTAIQEQLGLRLETIKAPLEGVVIDSAERPSEN